MELIKPFYRFQLYQQGDQNDEGKIQKSKTVGMAYLKEGQEIYTLRLWTFLNNRFYLLPNKNDASRYWVMTREPNLSPSAKAKYFWNIVGNAQVDSANGCVRIHFDLLEKLVLMNLFPESSPRSTAMPDPEALEAVA